MSELLGQEGVMLLNICAQIVFFRHIVGRDGMDGRMDGKTNGWMGGRMDGWTDRVLLTVDSCAAVLYKSSPCVNLI